MKHLNVLSPTHIRTDSRGIFMELINSGTWKSLAYGRMKKGAVMGNHYHKKTDVFFFLISGRVRIQTQKGKTNGQQALVLHAREGIIIPRGLPHAIMYEAESVFVWAKSRPFDENNQDIYEYVLVESKQKA